MTASPSVFADLAKAEGHTQGQAGALDRTWTDGSSVLAPAKLAHGDGTPSR